jgi:arylsulfatase
LPQDFYSTITYTDKIIEFIDSNAGDDKPFFAYLALTAPHWPLQVPAEYLDRNKGRYDDGYDVLRAERIRRAEALGVVPAVDPDLFEPTGPAWAELGAEQQRDSARRMELYATMMELMDENIGRLVEHMATRRPGCSSAMAGRRQQRRRIACSRDSLQRAGTVLPHSPITRS